MTAFALRPWRYIGAAFATAAVLLATGRALNH